MRRVMSPDDEARDIQTWEVDDGYCIRIDGKIAREYGVASILNEMGFLPNPEQMPRKPVYQHGRQVGTVPGFFLPEDVRSRSWLYGPRPGDFVAHEDGFMAAPMLGPGDLEAVIGFQRD